MKTVRAFWASVPKTFPKNREATVTPPLRISSFDEALNTMLVLRPCRSEDDVITHAKYATLARMYRIMQIPSPSGPAILRVRMGSFTLFMT